MNRQDIGFLLALGALPLACGDDDDGSTAGDGGTTTGTASDGMTSMTSTATTTTTGTTTTGTTGTTTGSTTSGDDTTTGDETTAGTTGDETGGTTTGGEGVCADVASWYVQCYPRYAAYAAYIEAECNYYLGLALAVDGQACGDAFEDFFACIASLDCQDNLFEECEAQEQALEAACPTLFEDGEDTDDGGEPPP